MNPLYGLDSDDGNYVWCTNPEHIGYWHGTPQPIINVYEEYIGDCPGSHLYPQKDQSHA